MPEKKSTCSNGYTPPVPENYSRVAYSFFFLANPSMQTRLAAVFREARTQPQFGVGETATVNGINYCSVFNFQWLVGVDVQFVLGQRYLGQLPDIDNLWRSFQNALGFPNRALDVPGVKLGDQLYTVVVNDHQFTRFSVTRVPDVMVSPEEDVLIANFSAMAPPALRLALAV